MKKQLCILSYRCHTNPPYGASVRAFGKFVSADTENEFRAVLVLFESQLTQTSLTAIEKTTDGYNLTIQETNGASTSCFLPETATVRLEGNGPLDIDELTAWVTCQSRSVTIRIADETTSPPTLSELIVSADELSLEVVSKDEDKLILSTADGTIKVSSLATLFRLDDDEQELIEFNGIQVGDELKLFGISACSNDEEGFIFYAYVVIVLPEN